LVVSLYLITQPSNGLFSHGLFYSHIAGIGPAQLLLSNNLVAPPSSIGTVVGDFSVIKGSTKLYSYTMTAGGSVFTVTDSTLALGIPVVSSMSVPITVQANDTGDSVVIGSFVIVLAPIA
jgi:hypothetical protein